MEMHDTTSLHRLFYALLLPPSLLDAIAALTTTLRDADGGHDVRWTSAENLHITLRFLGEVDTRKRVRAAELLREAVMPERIVLRVGRLDAFPSLRRPSVIVLGVRDEEEGLREAWRMADTFADALGIPPEERAFRPHITLGRVRRGRTIGAELGSELQSRTIDLHSFAAQGIALMESSLLLSGARYEIVERR